MKNDALLGRIRALAVRQQRSAPQDFMSVREAARTFNVSISTVAGVYRRLTHEGLLTTVRGSRTILRGKSTARVLKIQGLIGMPVCVQRMALHDYRSCFMHLQRELFSCGFATRCAFFEGSEPNADWVLREFASENIDAVLWLLPDGSRREAILRLRDCGIQFIGISFAAAADEVFCRYEVRRRDAIAAIFRNWHRHRRIDSATVLRFRHETISDAERLSRIDHLARAERIKCEFETLSERNLAAPLSSLCSTEGRALVITASTAAALASREPEMIGNLLAACQVALIDGPIRIPVPHAQHDATADVVTVGWNAIARRIANDLAIGDAFATDESIIFEGKPLLGVPLRQLGAIC